MNCNVKGCPGHYEEDYVSLAKEVEDKPVLVSNVPALVCDFCGDVLTTWDTMAQVDAFVKTNPPVVATAPVFNFALQWTSQPLEEPVLAGLASENGHR